mgnify:CR=1 FL=1
MKSTEQTAIHIRKGTEVIGQISTVFFGGIQHFKQAIEIRAEIRAVGLGMAFDGNSEFATSEALNGEAQPTARYPTNFWG